MTVVAALALAALAMVLTLDGWWLLLVAIPLLPAIALLGWVLTAPALTSVVEADELHMRRKDAARCGEPDPADWWPFPDDPR